MPLYNMTQNVTNIFALLGDIETQGDVPFAEMGIILIFFVAFQGMHSNSPNMGTARAFSAATFITFLLSGIVFTFGYLNEKFLYAVVVLFAVSIIVLYFSKKEPY